MSPAVFQNFATETSKQQQPLIVDQSQLAAPTMQENASTHPHTYLHEKYVQEEEARQAYVPKFTHQNPKGFAEGRGPVDLHNTSLYTKKLENYLNQAVYES